MIPETIHHDYSLLSCETYFILVFHDLILTLCVVLDRFDLKDFHRTISSLLDGVSHLLPNAKHQSDEHREKQRQMKEEVKEKLSDVLSLQSIENDPTRPGDPAPRNTKRETERQTETGRDRQRQRETERQIQRKRDRDKTEERAKR